MGHIITRDDGAEFHVGGRLAPKTPHRFALHDPKYGLNLAAWPTPEETAYCDIPAAQQVLGNIYRNNALGCCTEADQLHRQALRQAAAGNPVYLATDLDVTALYSRDGGFVEGRPETDQGCDEVTVMWNAQNLGIPSGSEGKVDQITGFILVDATNRALVRAVVSAFVGASICMGLPDEWIAPFPSSPGWTWDAPKGRFNPANGHCFTLGDQTDSKLRIMSWAMKAYLTYDALAAGAVASSGGALYVVLDQEIINQASQKAPDGLDWAALTMDLNLIPSGVMTPPGP